MQTDKWSRFWFILALALVILTTAGSIFAFIRYNRAQGIEISLNKAPSFEGEIHINGAVNNPGIYPLKDGDTLDSLIHSAGGVTRSGNSSRLILTVLSNTESPTPQKIDINRAESWLLQALPDIGKSRAQAIIDYRNLNGPFRNTLELTKVEGLGVSNYEKIKSLITVSE